MPFSEMKTLFDSIHQSPTEYLVPIRFLARAYEKGEAEKVQSYRRKLETIFPEGEFRYDLVRVRYDPVSYWRSRIYAETETLTTFEGERLPL